MQLGLRVGRCPGRKPSRSIRRLPGSVQQQLRDLLIGREAALLELRENLVAVLEDLEGPCGTGFELDFDGFVLECLLDFGGQTGRLGQVVSAQAVFDADLHGY
jgi:hypothetical protein